MMELIKKYVRTDEENQLIELITEKRKKNFSVVYKHFWKILFAVMALWAILYTMLKKLVKQQFKRCCDCVESWIRLLDKLIYLLEMLLITCAIYIVKEKKSLLFLKSLGCFLILFLFKSCL